jgi:hypothetical protein
MAHVMARFGPGSTEIYRDVLDQNQGKNGGFPPFCRWFSDVVEQENGAQKRIVSSRWKPKNFCRFWQAGMCPYVPTNCGGSNR